MSKHSISAHMPFGLGHVEVVIYFDFRPGAPAVRTLRNGDPGYPADPDEVEFLHAQVDGVRPADLPQGWDVMIRGWATEHLAGDGYDDAVEKARADIAEARADAQRASRDEVA